MEQQTLINLMTLASSLGGIIQSSFISDFKACQSLLSCFYLSFSGKDRKCFVCFLVSFCLWGFQWSMLKSRILITLYTITSIWSGGNRFFWASHSERHGLESDGRFGSWGLGPLDTHQVLFLILCSVSARLKLHYYFSYLTFPHLQFHVFTLWGWVPDGLGWDGDVKLVVKEGKL